MSAGNRPCVRRGGMGKSGSKCKACRDQRTANRLLDTGGAHYPGAAVSRGSYVNGVCRCDLCTAANTAHVRNGKARKESLA